MEVNDNSRKLFSKENDNQLKKVINLDYAEIKFMTSFKKSRKIPLKEYSLSGSITSIKNDNPIEYESSLERDFICLLEFDREVLRYCEQPINLKMDGVFYTPDFYIEYSSGRREIVEIKYSDDLLLNYDKYSPKFELAKQYCLDNDITFKILTEADIRNEYLDNVKFLLRFKGNFCLNFSATLDHQADIILLKTNLKNLGSPTVKQLLNHSTSCISKRAELIHILWMMVSIGEIRIDLDIKLNMNSKIWL
jgi:hypothetical protein